MGTEVDRFPAAGAEPGAVMELIGGWTAGSGPLYRRLADALERAVRDGSLPAGARLPAERALAAALAVSRATVVAAYDALRDRELAVSRRGSGTRIAGRPGVRPPPADGRVQGGQATAVLQRLVDGPAAGGGTISLALADGAAAPEVRAALEDVLRDDLDALLAGGGYHPGGLPVLRAAVADHFTRLGLRTEPGQILVTTGATQGLALAAQMYLRRGSVAVVEAPGWPGCFDTLRAPTGARTHGVPLDEDGLTAAGLAAALAAGPALLYAMPTYQNPTGTLMSAARRQRVADLVAEHRVPLVEDIAYDMRLDDRDEPPPIAAFARPGAEILTLGSLTKSVWGGLRIGWVRGPAAAVERLGRFKAVADLGTPVLDQALAARLLPRVAELRAGRAPELRHRMEHFAALLATALPRWSWQRPDGGSALWIRLPDGVDARVYAQVALRHGVEVVPGAQTDPGGGHDDFIRVPFTLPAERLPELVRRLRDAWAVLERKGTE
ncbi:PLP-dependent aminotransferase family protein [Streptomyces sp. A7024]|uniref:PLP-dependent aminotransferase family protein n=1 Tax=Streptomyces coryli TaxID=1128680 RepID=A0A6G4U3M5_9ACTN|nr:PLP-dependent aminotransferase family protein [Streptomyces coryli]NGN66835.1 PLP-dependent aminotransferase family protein [Streptomyces coryli]